MTNAPWTSVRQVFLEAPGTPTGKYVLASGKTLLAIFENEADCDATADMRAALACQMEYGWSTERIFDGPWKGSWKVVITDGITDFKEWNAWWDYCGNHFPDPATALATAYRWKKEREATP